MKEREGIKKEEKKKKLKMKGRNEEKKEKILRNRHVTRGEKEG